jgi:phage terminase large subunit GpA-like protein
MIDSNYETPSVIAYVRPRFGQRVYACRGEEKIALKAMVAKGRTKKERALQIRVATWDAKDLIQRRLAIGDDRPHRIYLPDWVSDSYLQQLTSEKLIKQTNRRTGRTKLTWVKLQERNEALDLWVYGFAGLRALQEFHGRKKYTDVDALLEARTASPEPAAPAKEQPPTRSRAIARRPKLPAHRR